MRRRAGRRGRVPLLSFSPPGRRVPEGRMRGVVLPSGTSSKPGLPKVPSFEVAARSQTPLIRASPTFSPEGRRRCVTARRCWMRQEQYEGATHGRRHLPPHRRRDRRRARPAQDPLPEPQRRAREQVARRHYGPDRLRLPHHRGRAGARDDRAPRPPPRGRMRLRAGGRGDGVSGRGDARGGAGRLHRLPTRQGWPIPS